MGQLDLRHGEVAQKQAIEEVQAISQRSANNMPEYPGRVRIHGPDSDQVASKYCATMLAEVMSNDRWKAP